MRRCRNRKNGIQNNKETGAIGCILSRRFLLLFVFPVPDKDTAKKTVDKYKVGVCFLNGTLEEEGIRTNVTLVFSRSQALAVARLGAKFVSPFVGWKENFGEDTASYLQDIVETYRNYSYDTEIIVAAVRSGKVLADAARMGADIVTCSLEVMKNSVYHPFTDYGLRFFTEAWNAVEAME